MPDDLHGDQLRQTAAEKGDQKQCTFGNAPSVGDGASFVDDRQQGGEQRNDRKIDGDNEQYRLIHGRDTAVSGRPASSCRPCLAL